MSPTGQVTKEQGRARCCPGPQLSHGRATGRGFRLEALEAWMGFGGLAPLYIPLFQIRKLRSRERSGSRVVAMLGTELKSLPTDLSALKSL